MRRSDDASAETDPVEWVADDMHLGVGDVANGIAVVRVSEDEHWVEVNPVRQDGTQYEIVWGEGGRGWAGFWPLGTGYRRLGRTGSNKVSNIRRYGVRGVVDKLPALAVSRQDELRVRALRVSLDRNGAKANVSLFQHDLASVGILQLCLSSALAQLDLTSNPPPPFSPAAHLDMQPGMLCPPI